MENMSVLDSKPYKFICPTPLLHPQKNKKTRYDLYISYLALYFLFNLPNLAIPLTLLDINHIYWVFNILSYH